MPALKIRIPLDFTNTALDKLRDDAILPDAGALLLLDPTHPANPWAAAVANGAVVPNIAYPQAKALIPAGNADNLALKVAHGSSWATAGGLSERTTKGGIHFMPPRATPGDANTTARLNLVDGTTPLNAYLRANPGHAYYTALWGKVSRPGLALSAGVGAHLHSRSDGSTQIYGFYNRPAGGATQYPNDARQLGHYGTGVAPATVGGNFFQDQATQPTATNSANIEAMVTGNVTGTDYGKAAGFIVYGFYLEDLTVSGRSYATVSALTQAKYSRDVLTAGGRYHGDTFTTVA